MVRRVAWTLGVAGMLAATAVPAAAKEYQVAMVDRAPEGTMAFAPGYLKVAPGDTVRFVPRDKGHNAESIVPLTPKGAPTFKGALNQEVVVTFKTPGLYGYKCLPHFGMGMVGVIQVGAAVNQADFVAGVAKLPPFAKVRMTNYLKQVH